MSEVERRESGLFVAHGFNFLKYRAKKKTVTLKDGRRALVTVDDSGTVIHIETAEQLDAIVRPKAVTVKVVPRSVR